MVENGWSVGLEGHRFQAHHSPFSCQHPLRLSLKAQSLFVQQHLYSCAALQEEKKNRFLEKKVAGGQQSPALWAFDKRALLPPLDYHLHRRRHHCKTKDSSFLSPGYLIHPGSAHTYEIGISGECFRQLRGIKQRDTSFQPYVNISLRTVSLTAHNLCSRLSKTVYSQIILPREVWSVLGSHQSHRRIAFLTRPPPFHIAQTPPKGRVLSSNSIAAIEISQGHHLRPLPSSEDDWF